jgi:hypothetical protein
MSWVWAIEICEIPAQYQLSVFDGKMRGASAPNLWQVPRIGTVVSLGSPWGRKKVRALLWICRGLDLKDLKVRYLIIIFPCMWLVCSMISSCLGTPNIPRLWFVMFKRISFWQSGKVWSFMIQFTNLKKKRDNLFSLQSSLALSTMDSNKKSVHGSSLSSVCHWLGQVHTPLLAALEMLDQFYQQRWACRMIPNGSPKLMLSLWETKSLRGTPLS